jgi:predicted MFS family arabinose efflux permease
MPSAAAKSSTRWVVLGLFSLVAGITQMLWLNFAPLLTLVQTRYGVSQLMASGLVLVFPLIYVFLSLPAGALIDARGYRFTVGVGAVATAAFSALRIIDGGFWLLMAAQVGIAAAQPFVINGISKLVADWFDESLGATANGIGTLGMFLGMAVGMAATPSMAESWGLGWTMAAFFAIAAVAAGAFVAFVRENPTPATVATTEERGFGPLLKNRQLVLCFGVGALGLGSFNGLTTWLEEILAPQGISAVTAGIVGGVMILGGLVGAVVIPLLSDKMGRRKPWLLVCVAIAAASMWPLCRSSSVGLSMALAAVLGFFFLPAFALLLDVTAVLAGVQRAGAATSVLMLAGNGGAVVVIVAVPLMKDALGGYGVPVAFMAGLLGAAVVLLAWLREPQKAAA